jgi:uncharacterized membrane protein
MTEFLLGLALFLASHSVGLAATTQRQILINRLGLPLWKGLISVLSLIALVLLVTGFGEIRHTLPVLWTPPPLMKLLAVLLMAPVFPMLLASGLPGRIQRTLKHPMLVAVKTWALAHLLANGGLADLLLFGSLLAWAVADRISMKRRIQNPRLTPPDRPWNDAVAVAGGLVMYGVFLMGLHQTLMGASPLP